MGTYKGSPLNPWSGKVGAVQFSNWMGILVVKSMPQSYNDAKTAAQIVIRARAAAISKLLSGFLSAIRLGFKGVGLNMSAYNAGQRANSGVAMSGAAIDPAAFPSISISNGNAQALGTATGELGNEPTLLDIECPNNADNIDGFGTDIIHLAVVKEDGTKPSSFLAIGTRASLAAGVTVDVGAAYVDSICHGYLFAQRADGSAQSDTRYFTFDLA